VCLLSFLKRAYFCKHCSVTSVNGMCTIKELFYCQSLRYLFISDNELIEIPSMIGSLIYLEQLDISRNG